MRNTVSERKTSIFGSIRSRTHSVSSGDTVWSSKMITIVPNWEYVRNRWFFVVFDCFLEVSSPFSRNAWFFKKIGTIEKINIFQPDFFCWLRMNILSYRKLSEKVLESEFVSHFFRRQFFWIICGQGCTHLPETWALHFGGSPFLRSKNRLSQSVGPG